MDIINGFYNSFGACICIMLLADPYSLEIGVLLFTLYNSFFPYKVSTLTSSYVALYSHGDLFVSESNFARQQCTCVLSFYTNVCMSINEE